MMSRVSHHCCISTIWRRSARWAACRVRRNFSNAASSPARRAWRISCRSAVVAVEKAGQFPELQQLESRLFEKNFRRLRLKFKPEDLRY